MANHVITETYKMLIDGEMVEAPTKFGVINPATGKVFAEAPECTKEQLDRAFEAANRAFKTWRKDPAARKAALAKCAGLVQEHAQELAQLLTMEQGKPLQRATEEIFLTSSMLLYYSCLDLPNEVIFEDETKKMEIMYKPLGVAAAITPWNFPLILAAFKIAPCLLAGNTLVLKPSPYTPLTSLKLGEILQNALPKGVLNIVSGSDSLGALMTQHPLVRKISFTGSVPTGKKVAIAAAPDLKRVTLELGGNDPAIVLQDVDPISIAQKIFWNAFANTGQICLAIKRVYVQESIYDQFVEEIVRMAKQVKMGDGMLPDTQLGPLNNKMQFERVQELLKDARSKGAKFETGGEVFGDGGYFIKPAILTNIKEGFRIVDEEQFGPALPILKFKTVEEAIERANNTHYGLGASVWTKDLNLGKEIASQIDSGTTWVNTHLDLDPLHAPFGGSKWSGIGYEGGIWAVKGYCHMQVINVAKIPKEFPSL